MGWAWAFANFFRHGQKLHWFIAFNCEPVLLYEMYSLLEKF